MSENIDIITRKENIVAIADAVRAKNGTTAEMTLGEIVSSIEGIQTGGSGEVETCTVTVTDAGNLFGVMYTQLIDNEITSGYVETDFSNFVSGVTISNVVKDSVMFGLGSDSLNSAEITGNAELLFAMTDYFAQYTTAHLYGFKINGDCTIFTDIG